MIKGPFNTFPIGARPLLTEADLDYQRLAVDQPPGGGSFYPFTRAHVLTPLIGDFYLSYSDPGPRFAWPFRVIWLHGFGLGPAEPPVGSMPIHVRDIAVADANDQVVFDSSTEEATTFSDVGWGARRVVEWQFGTTIARLVFYEGKLSEYFDEQVYSDAVLDARTCNRLPRRVDKIFVQPVAQMTGDVGIVAGYNVQLDVVEAVPADGTRAASSITINGIPGAGLGLLPCGEAALGAVTIKTINRVAPNPAGKFIIQVADCLRAERAVQVIHVPPFGARDAMYPSDSARASFVLYNDCGPCCECVDYSHTYAGLKRTWDDWQQVTNQAMYVRDQFGRNAARWSAQGECRREKPVEALVVREPECHISALARFCNQTACCLANVVVRLTVQRYVSGAHYTGLYRTTAIDAYLGDAERYAPREYLGNGGAVYDFIFDGTEARASAIAKLRLCVPCESDNSVKVTVTAHATAGGNCDAPPEVPVPPDIVSLWAALGVDALHPMRGMTVVSAPLDPMPASSGPCDCE